MNVLKLDIPGPLIIEPNAFGDARGFFMETWNEETFRKAGLDLTFVQDNHSRSRKGVLRGLHFQNPGAQGKLVRVTRGAVYDVAVDLRRSSENFGKWVGVKLTAENKRIFWIPEGFAHGFLTLADDTDFLYKCTSPYSPETEQTLAWNDPTVGIKWPIEDLDPIISEKDSEAKSLLEIGAFQ